MPKRFVAPGAAPGLEPAPLRSPAGSLRSPSDPFPGMCTEPPPQEIHPLVMRFIPILGVPHEKASLNLPYITLHLLRLSFLWGRSRSLSGVWSWLAGTAVCDDDSFLLHCSTPSLKCETQPQAQLRSYQHLNKQKGNPYTPDPGCFPPQWLYSAGQWCQCLFRPSEIMGIWKNSHCTNPVFLSCCVFPPASSWFLQLCNYFADF